MKKSVIIDTNVAIVANNRSSATDLDCLNACILALTQARQQVILMDDVHRIFIEYRRHLSHSGQPGAGDAFFRWLWNNQANPRHCRLIAITTLESDDADFEEFPKDAELVTFDRNDRKFVAVALASGIAPVILNATDTDWWIYRKALERNHVHVQFLCPHRMGVNDVD